MMRNSFAVWMYCFLSNSAVALPAGQYFYFGADRCAVFECAREVSPVASSPCSMSTAPSLLGKSRMFSLRAKVWLEHRWWWVDTREGELLIPLADDICKRM